MCNKIKVPKLYTMTEIAADHTQIPDLTLVKQWPHLKDVAIEMEPVDWKVPIGILLGRNCLSAMKPRDCITGNSEEPYAVRMDVGWGVVGNLKRNELKTKECSWSLRTEAKEVTPLYVAKMFEMEFQESISQKTMSVQDRKFIKCMEEGYQRDQNGRVTLPLPFKEEPVLPDNRQQVLSLTYKLRTKLKKDPAYRQQYKEFMTKLLQRGHAERVSQEELKTPGWFVTHFGVMHPKKQSLRVVFNVSLKYKNHILNTYLLQGPDLINNLSGVLIRYRKEVVVLMCDIETMFYQDEVRKDHRRFLRFYWWDTDDLDRSPVAFQMTVHLFGATSSPGCVNYSLRRIAEDHRAEFKRSTVQFIQENFYVDDGLDGMPTVAEAIDLALEAQQLCSKGKFNLHKFASNKREVLDALPVETRAKDIQQIDLSRDALPLERTLGILWCAQGDCFKFKVELPDKPVTRRGILSSVSSIYDPLGFLAPFILTGKRILQDICIQGTDWDEPLSQDIEMRWRNDLQEIAKIKIDRCYKPEGFDPVLKYELHHFSDASLSGYGQCSYLRMFNDKDQVATSLVMAKARVTPAKPFTIPRMELTACVTSVNVGRFLETEL